MSKNLWGQAVARLLAGPGMARARTFVMKFSRFVDVDETLLDLGCGTGQVGLFSRLYRRQNVTLADVRPPWWYIGQWLFGVPVRQSLGAEACHAVRGVRWRAFAVCRRRIRYSTFAVGSSPCQESRGGLGRSCTRRTPSRHRV